MGIPKLYHFDGPGRAELSRLLFTIGGVGFEDVRLSSEEWRVKYKPLSPTDQAPLLEVDGKLYAESKGVALYAANLGELLPTLLTTPKSLQCYSAPRICGSRVHNLPKEEQAEEVQRRRPARSA